jgi:hypothetical protein
MTISNNSKSKASAYENLVEGATRAKNRLRRSTGDVDLILVAPFIYAQAVMDGYDLFRHRVTDLSLVSVAIPASVVSPSPIPVSSGTL